MLVQLRWLGSCADADRTLKWFKPSGYASLKSSEESYHVGFDGAVTWAVRWAKNLPIVDWICLHSDHRKLLQWLLMQTIKRSSTLRMAAKKDRSSPRIVLRWVDRIVRFSVP
jgi:hypothetical protein